MLPKYQSSHVQETVLVANATIAAHNLYFAVFEDWVREFEVKLLAMTTTLILLYLCALRPVWEYL